SRIEILLIAVAPAVAAARTWPFHRSSIVIPGGMSSFQVRIVLPAATTLPGVAAAHPPGVIVQPRHGSSNPYPGAQASNWAGTVSQIETFHQVSVGERFLMNSE